MLPRKHKKKTGRTDKRYLATIDLERVQVHFFSAKLSDSRGAGGNTWHRAFSTTFLNRCRGVTLSRLLREVDVYEVGSHERCSSVFVALGYLKRRPSSHRYSSSADDVILEQLSEHIGLRGLDEELIPLQYELNLRTVNSSSTQNNVFTGYFNQCFCVSRCIG